MRMLPESYSHIIVYFSIWRKMKSVVYMVHKWLQSLIRYYILDFNTGKMTSLMFCTVTAKQELKLSIERWYPCISNNNEIVIMIQKSLLLMHLYIQFWKNVMHRRMNINCRSTLIFFMGTMTLSWRHWSLSLQNNTKEKRNHHMSLGQIYIIYIYAFGRCCHPELITMHFINFIKCVPWN